MTRVTKLLNLTKSRAGDLLRAMEIMGTESFTKCFDTLLAFYLAMMVLPHPGESVSFPCPGAKDTKDRGTTQVYNGANERELRAKIDALIDNESDFVRDGNDLYGRHFNEQREMIDSIVTFVTEKGFQR